MSSSSGHAQTLHKISWQSAQEFLRNPANNQVVVIKFKIFSLFFWFINLFGKKAADTTWVLKQILSLAPEVPEAPGEPACHPVFTDLTFDPLWLAL